MNITTDMIKKLRQATGAGVLDCKKALEATDGNLEKAIAHLRRKSLATAARKADRAAKEGLIEAYVHSDGRLAALVELNCETDFVARTEEFERLAHDIAMQVAATNPQYLSPEDIPPEVLLAKRDEYRAWAKEEGKPKHIIERIVEGKLEKFYQEVCLLKQPFIRDDDLTVEELINQAIAKTGENIVLRRFVRYKLGD